MKSTFASLTLAALSVLLPGPVSAGGPSVTIALDAQLWTRPLEAGSALKFRRLGDGAAIDVVLFPRSTPAKAVRTIADASVFATATFLLVPAAKGEAPYLVTQVRLFDARTKGLIAECANYDSVPGERAPGVGVCSGVIGADQFGLTLAKAKR